jgi:predicted transcriptional regulator
MALPHLSTVGAVVQADHHHQGLALGQGLRQSLRQIAGDLGISIKTVEKHRQNLMDKLHIHETASLTRYAISSGVIDNAVQTLLPL